MHTNYRIQGY